MGGRVMLKNLNGSKLSMFIALIAVVGMHAQASGAHVFKALGKGNKDTVIKAVRTGTLDVQAADNMGWTLLLRAAEKGDVDLVKRVLEKGAVVDAREREQGYSPLLLACAQGHTEIVLLLLAKNADMGIANSKRQTALMLAAQGGYAKIVELLLEHKAMLNVVDIWGNTALMYAVKHNHVVIAQKLIDAGAYWLRNAQCFAQEDRMSPEMQRIVLGRVKVESSGLCQKGERVMQQFNNKKHSFFARIYGWFA